MLTHLVLFGLKGFDSAEQKDQHIQRIKQALEALPQSITALHQLEVITNENPNESYDFALSAQVENLDALKAYAEHPEHERIVQELIRPYLSSRACIDYTR